MEADRRLWMAVRSIRASTSTATPRGMSSDSASSTFLASTFAPARTPDTSAVVHVTLGLSGRNKGAVQDVGQR